MTAVLHSLSPSIRWKFSSPAAKQSSRLDDVVEFIALKTGFVVLPVAPNFGNSKVQSVNNIEWHCRSVAATR